MLHFNRALTKNYREIHKLDCDVQTNLEAEEQSMSVQDLHTVEEWGGSGEACRKI